MGVAMSTEDQVVINGEEIDAGLAKAFARAYVDEGSNALKACMQLWPREPQKALRMSAKLMSNDMVKEQIKEAETNALSTLPSKAQYAMKLWQKMEDAQSEDSYHKLSKLYAEVRGFIEKPIDSQASNVVVIAPRCIEIPSAPSDEAWETKAAKQQAELMARAKNKSAK